MNVDLSLMCSLRLILGVGREKYHRMPGPDIFCVACDWLP